MLAKHSELINQHYKNSMIVSFFISRQIGRPKEFDEGEVLTGIMSAERLLAHLHSHGEKDETLRP